MRPHRILNIPFPDTACQKNISNELGISKITAQVLINRGIKSPKEAQRFLQINTSHFLNPFDFSDMHKAISLIKRSIDRKEKIMVFGDYDADGITSLAVLKDTLLRLGADVMHYLPHRIKQGYGLNKDAISTIKKDGVKLLITVDCGISNHNEIRQLNSCGVDTIITDHHEPSSDELPDASAIINPKIKKSGYKYRDLAGVGVAYKLSQGLTNSKLLDELDLVCVGTIADSAPLTGENRLIAKEGLVRIPKTKRLGLRALIEKAGVKNKKFNSTFVSFIIAPRINAGGRMDTAEISLSLLTSKKQQEAESLAKKIEEYNRERQKVESKILQEAEEIINKEVNFKEHKVIVIAREDWHQGVLGIVASKLADRFYRPTIVISLKEELCKGSARSIKNFHLFDALCECKELLNSFGGHSHAAGLLISKDSIHDFRNTINKIAHEKLALEDLLPSLEIDMELKFSDLSEDLVFELEKLAPYGVGNLEPLFYTRNLKLRNEPQVLGRETIKFLASDGVKVFSVIGFGMSSFKETLMQANSFDLVYTPRIDSWQDETSIILEAKDIFAR